MRYVLLLGLVLSIACSSHRPPNLTPTGQVAWNSTQVVKALDVLRDAAISANNGGLVNEDVTRRVVVYHRSSLEVIKSAPAGWQTIVQTALAQTMSQLPPDARELFQPYVDLLSGLLNRI